MKKLYFVILICLIGFSGFAQILTISDANFKAKLLAANPSVPIASGGFGNATIDTNGNGEIELSEALLIRWLNVSNSTIYSLEGISGFSNLTTLICNNNNLTVFNVSSLINLTTIDCSYNQLESLDVNSLSNLQKLNCSHNELATLNAEQINNKFTRLDCSYNNLTSLSVPNFFPFLDEGRQEMSLLCSHNQLSQITFNQTNGRENLSYLDLSYNNFADLTLSNITIYGSVNLSDNPLNNLAFSNFNMGPQDPDDTPGLSIQNTNLSQLTIPRTSNTYLRISNNPNLIYLNIKNNSPNVYSYVYYIDEEEYYGLEGVVLENNPLLAKVCCDADEVNFISSLVPSVQVSEYCNFTPGGNYNTITGTVSLTCPDGNAIDSNIKMIVNTNYSNFTQGLNTHIAYTYYGNQNVSLSLPNPDYFTVTPPNYTFNFVNYGNSETVHFCLTPNGNHQDLAIALLPLTPARPGFNATYRIVYTNNGNQAQSGKVVFNFNESVLDLVTANPNADLQSPGMLTWNFANLAPFETRTINCILNVNSEQEIPAVNINDILDFSTIVSSDAMEETPIDNTFSLSQPVVGAYDPNDKLVTEGRVIDITKVGDYLHYVIRFQNKGNFAAENVVVKDELPYSLDHKTLKMIAASHPYRSILSGNKLEFFFENIQLPSSDADEPGSHGFVSFKIKPASIVGIGSEIENKASIYFDFNFPIVTNTTSTTVTALGNKNFKKNRFALYPNPVKNFINVEVTTGNIQSIAIYNLLGQIVKSVSSSESGSIITIDVSQLKSGTYFMEIISNAGKETKKFVKL